MNSTARTTFQDELVNLQSLVLDLGQKVKDNGELLLQSLKNKETISELSQQIKEKDKQIDNARWQVHDFGDQLIVLQQPVAKDFRQIITSIQVTDNLERIGDHFKKVAKLSDKISLAEVELPEEIIEMANSALKMLTEAITAYSEMFKGKENKVALLDDHVDYLYKQTVKKIVLLIKNAPEDKIDSLSKLFFVVQNFERAADHAAKIGQLVNFAVTGERK